MKAPKSHIPLEIPPESDPSFRRVVIGLLVLAEVMLYTPSLVHGLAGYDYVFRELHSRSLLSLWSTPTDALGHWRPLSYSVNHVLFSSFGEAPFYWHLFNVLVHLTSVLVFFQILRRLSESSEKRGLIGPMLAAIVFQVHPAAVQNVYWASGFSDLLCMLFLLLTTLCSAVMVQKQKTHLIAVAAAFFAAALLSKESAIVFPMFLALVLRLTLGSWQSVIKLQGRLLGLLSLLSFLFGVAFIAVSGHVLFQQSGLFAGAPGVFLRGFGMLVIPTDAMRLYQLGADTPLAAVGLGALLVFIFVLLLRMKLLNLNVTLLFVLTFLAGFAVYAVGGYISLRLMYGSVGFFVLALFIVLTRNPWWTNPDLLTQITRWCVALCVLATLFLSFSAVMDWHVADKFAKAIRASFVDFHLAALEKEYVFGAVPSRIRQAEVVGEPGTDFRGELRQDEMSDSVDMRSLLRIVLLDRDDVSANVVLLRNSDTSLIVSTQTENQFFLLGKVDTPLRLPVGTSFKDGSYTIEVLDTILDSRAVTVKVTVTDPVDLDRLLFYDDQEREFVPLQGLEPVSQDDPDE